MGGEPTGYCDGCGNDIDPHHPCKCYETCACGDYRKDHKDGTGPCIFNGGRFDLCHGGTDCHEFRGMAERPGLVDWRNAFNTEQ